MLARFGFNTGLRISDILPIKAKHIVSKEGRFAEYVVIKERKTSKEKKIALNDKMKSELWAYMEKFDLNGEDFLSFHSKMLNDTWTEQTHG